MKRLTITVTNEDGSERSVTHEPKGDLVLTSAETHRTVLVPMLFALQLDRDGVPCTSEEAETIKTDKVIAEKVDPSVLESTAASRELVDELQEEVDKTNGKVH